MARVFTFIEFVCLYNIHYITSYPKPVSRMEGSEALKGGIFVYYKDRKTKFRAHSRVRFEGEEGVVSGPVREFLLNAMKIAD